MRVHLTWMFEFEKRNRRVGVTALEIMSWDGENWTLRWYHTDYFKRVYFFGRDLI